MGITFLRTTRGSDKVIGTATLEESGSVIIDVTDAALRDELEGGVAAAGGTRYMPKDGISFIKAVLRKYSGSHLRAVPLR